MRDIKESFIDKVVETIWSGIQPLFEKIITQFILNNQHGREAIQECLVSNTLSELTQRLDNILPNENRILGEQVHQLLNNSILYNQQKTNNETINAIHDKLMSKFISTLKAKV